MAGGCRSCCSHLAEGGKLSVPSPSQPSKVEAATAWAQHQVPSHRGSDDPCWASRKAIWPLCLLPASLFCPQLAQSSWPPNSPRIMPLLMPRAQDTNIPISPQVPRDQLHPT